MRRILSVVLVVFVCLVCAQAQTTDKAKILPAVFQAGTLTNQLISYWKLDEVSGTRYDSYGTNNLTSVNNMGSGTGMLSNCILSNTVNSYLSGTTNFNYAIFSFSVWFNPKSYPAYQMILCKYSDSLGKQFYLDIENASKLDFITQSNNLSAQFGNNNYSTFTFTSTNTWYHAVCIVSNSWIFGYLNGTNWLLRDTGNNINTNSSAKLLIGAYNEASSSLFFTGSIDETAIWSRALTTNEISQLYNAGRALKFPIRKTIPWK